MSDTDQMRKNAENCAELAENAKDAPSKERFKRMEKAWRNLADNQEWLDGEGENPPPERRH